MKFLKNVLDLAEGTDLTELPYDVVQRIRSNIVVGAKDTNQKWSNALELVHKAYELSGKDTSKDDPGTSAVPRPTPNMKAAWKQYEENIQYSVAQLAKYRGTDDDWKMSSSSLHEATKMKTFLVKLDLPEEENDIEAFIDAVSMDDVIAHVKDTLTSTPKSKNHEVRVEEIEKNGVRITAWLHDVRDNGVITIFPKR